MDKMAGKSEWKSNQGTCKTEGDYVAERDSDWILMKAAVENHTKKKNGRNETQRHWNKRTRREIQDQQSEGNSNDDKSLR